MRVLVTGACGFIGSQVVKKLLADGHEVVAVDRRQDLLARLAPGDPRLVPAAGDLDDIPATRTLLADTTPDALVHLAWYARPDDYLVSHENLTSLNMTVRLIQAALAVGCRKLVLAGTCVEYATVGRPLTEDDPVDPRSLYGGCKHAAWWVTRSLATAAGAELSWARVFHLHGPGEDATRLIPWVARELRAGRPVELTDGTQVRDHLHVSDVAAGFVTLLARGTSGVFNLCSGQPVTLRQVLETVGEIVGRRDLLRFGARPHRPGEAMFLAGDSSRLRALSWRPRFGLRDGLLDALGGGGRQPGPSEREG